LLFYVIPFFLWIALMTILPSTALNYAIRGGVVAAALIGGCILLKKHPFVRVSWKSLLFGILGGILVTVIWILPESCEWYKTWLCWPPGVKMSPIETPSPYDPLMCGWTLTIIKLIASSFIIAPVEEIFFRSFLYRWLQKKDFESVPLSKFNLTAFVWMVTLFAIEHDRFFVAAIAGAVYGLLAIRFSLSSAIIGHVTTNLLLALYVIHEQMWSFW
jgi:CAAX prenyl protease-like protein